MRPTPRLLWVGLALAASALIPSLNEQWLLAWFALPALAVLVAFVDAWRVHHIQLHVERQVPQVLAHRAWEAVHIKVKNTGRSIANLTLYDHHPEHFNAHSMPQSAYLKPNREMQLHYDVQALSRGDAQFAGTDVRVHTNLGLWSKKHFFPVASDIKVYPNLRSNHLFGKLLSRQYLNSMGIRKLPIAGEGNDFHQLREYRNGDSLRQIDWKATARVQKLISREYAQERDQQIVFLMDCSLRMRHSDGDTSHMDDALNAILLLSQVAIEQGDATGIMTFGGIDRWVPPSKGTRATKRLLQSLYDLEATRELPDYAQAVESLAHRLRRRALIILISNLRNEDGQSALQALQKLNRKHLVLMANLRETDLDNTVKHKPRTVEEASLWLSAEGYRFKRQQQHQLALASGARVLDVSPQQLSAELVTKYLAIKAQALL